MARVILSEGIKIDFLASRVRWEINREVYHSRLLGKAL
jgi:hypothetical protein